MNYMNCFNSCIGWHGYKAECVCGLPVIVGPIFITSLYFITLTISLATGAWATVFIATFLMAPNIAMFIWSKKRLLREIAYAFQWVQSVGLVIMCILGIVGVDLLNIKRTICKEEQYGHDDL